MAPWARMSDFDERLASMVGLKADWDSYGAKPITEAAIKTAGLMVPIPSRDGGIDLELHAGGIDLTIEIDPDGTVKSIYWEEARGL